MRSQTITTILGGVLLAAVGLAQQPPPADQQQQYPPTQQQYPPAQQQYPPAQQQYPPAQQQYPPQQYPQQQYPPQQGYPQQQQPYPQQPAYGQPGPYGNPPMMAPQQLDALVGRIALYPDPLLAQVLTASTFWNEIPDAAGWADAHRFLRGDQLARAIQDDRLPFDPSVIALLPFPQVLDMLAQDPGWTQQLGTAVLAQRPDVMDAVQRERQRAASYGYLQSNSNVQVIQTPGAIQIVPVNPGYIYVPVYNPAIVYARPRPGFFIGGAITFGPSVYLGAAFAPWGWGGIGLDWRAHSFIVGGRPWERTWTNRAVVGPGVFRSPRYEGPRVEHHEREIHERGREHRDERR